MIICEICGTTHNHSASGEHSEICQSCFDKKWGENKSHVVNKKEVYPTVKKVKSALKRVLKGNVSKVLKVRECPASIEKIIKNASERWNRLSDIKLEGITSLVFEEKFSSRFMIAYQKDGKIFQGYFS